MYNVRSTVQILYEVNTIIMHDLRRFAILVVIVVSFNNMIIDKYCAYTCTSILTYSTSIHCTVLYFLFLTALGCLLILINSSFRF